MATTGAPSSSSLSGPYDDQQDRQFLGRIESAIATVKAWDEDPSLLAECRGLIPISRVSSDFRRPDDIHVAGNALFLKHLTLYFKEEVMTWVNRPSCVQCGCTDERMEARQTRGPESQEERDGGASRVEVYYCPDCQENTTTFPRYNSVRKLLETRKGRCGEFANLFGLYCRAVGFEVRYCADFTDHVWVECLVDGHWVMADACEGLIGKVSMYEDGWKKDLSYIVGVTTESVIDVTPRYTRQWFSPDFQARRRAVCSSEQAGQRMIQQCNAALQQSCSKNRCDELNRRMEREQRVLGSYQQTTEWTDEEQHGQGRISGSLQWKLSRKEAGTLDQQESNGKSSFVQSWHVESFYPLPPNRGDTRVVSISVACNGIVVSGAKCSVGGSAICVVVIDEVHLGCVLQSRGFQSWNDLSGFVQTLPAHRIVAIAGGCDKAASGDSDDKEGLSRLGGLSIPAGDDKLLYLGQVDALPSWADCTDDSESTGIHRVFSTTDPTPSLMLRTERDTVPRRMSWRLPETIMPLQTQLMASEEQKRVAFLRFSEQRKYRSKQYSGYTSKAGSPVYLLDASAYPFSHVDGWNTFHFLPAPMVPEDDIGIAEKSTKQQGIPKVEIPLDASFFMNLLGPSLLVNSGSGIGSTPALVDTSIALQNRSTRLVALYFSAHWCGPCRQFTPMLAELYSHLREEFPTHGLEVVFVSSDRDVGGFQQYFGTMPWTAILFGSMVIPQIKQRFGVRGIPAFVVLDAMSGQVVVAKEESRREVMQACQRGDEGIEGMLNDWMARIPQESQEILAMLELSCEETDSKTDGKESTKEHPYLTRSSDDSATPVQDPAVLVKEYFAKFVAEGMEPNVAAAKAIQSLQQKSNGTSSTLDPGPLNDINWKAATEVIPSSSKNASLVTSLNESDATAMQTVISTTLKYLENTRREPWTPKFRSFKLSNKIVDRITRVEGALDLLCSLGLYVYPTETDFLACIPLAADLDEMETTMKTILSDSSQES